MASSYHRRPGFLDWLRQLFAKITPRACQSSSARCGANGDSSSTNFCIASFGRTSSLKKKFVNSIIRAMAVLNDICSMSLVTALMVLCSMRFCSAVGAASCTAGFSCMVSAAVVDDQSPDAVQKVSHAAYAVHAPGFYGLQAGP